MSNNKQSSVEWLYDNLNKCFEKFDNGEYSYTDFVNASKEVKEQAKEMEKKQSSVFEKRSKLELEIIKQIDNTCRRLGYKLIEIKIEKL